MKKAIILMFGIFIFGLSIVNSASYDSDFQKGYDSFLNGIKEKEEPIMTIFNWLMQAYIDCVNQCWSYQMDCGIGCCFYEFGTPEFNSCQQSCNSGYSACRQGCYHAFGHANDLFFPGCS